MRNHRQPARLALLVAALVVAPAWAEPRPEVRDELRRRAAERGLTPEQSQAILDRAGRLESSGLPAATVLDRYLEGLARGAPLPRIESAVDQLEGRLRDSARRVDAAFPGGPDAGARSARLVLIDHCAYALSVGVPADGVDQALRLAAAARSGPAAGGAPVLAVSCLVAGGLDAAASLDLVRTAWTNGCRGRDLERLGRELGALGRPGQGPPPELLRQVHEALRSHADRESLFRQLESLRDHHGPGRMGPPGSRPGDDPSDMRGPGGPSQDPAHQGPGGRRPHRP